ncbi:EboA domain-containing protein [Pontibacter harenae]|uniref:EboA domain-containing protein n=1 Tax=Pontibacter harenae TaxID=2894083 RepID=UPI001E40AB2C|nr:EboA domain-containing protein [Pontibacter harenae]MCC9167441.1 EboA domain-containing protein [Pontibacter harenae]
MTINLQTVQQADITNTRSYLHNLLAIRATEKGMQWLDQKLEQVSKAGAAKDFYLAFSAAPRFMGKSTLDPTEEELAAAAELREGFYPANWTVDQTARSLLLLSLPQLDKEAFLEKVNMLFNTADMGELVALYASLPLLPYPEAFADRAAEGIRTNMSNVLEAVTLENPYPADFLSEGAWNQLVLKTLFVGKSLYRIYGLERRANQALANTLSDYAHERWAAGRPVTPELWRTVGPFIDDNILNDIRQLFEHPDEIQHEAAALACSQSNHAGAEELLNQHPHLKEKIKSGSLTWDTVGKKAYV